jgi:ssDNA-binding Zn-finger/Zn-ribbon topoisomerase 1
MTAWRISANCPLCSSPLRLRANRRDGDLFVGCSGFPRCRFAEPFDAMTHALAERIVDLEDRLDRALVAQPSSPSDVIEKALRSLIVFAHPDRWPDNPLAHEITVRLTALRDEVRA